MQGPAARPADLPDFENPPVTEIVLSIQFAAQPGLANVHAGLFWNLIRKDYPKFSEQPPLAPAFETFGIPMFQPPFRIDTFFTPPMPRFWFESEDGQHLVQLQQDRVLHNWRLRPDGVYPRYEAVRQKFASEVETLETLLTQEKLGNFLPNQCEVIYINTIELEQGIDPIANLHRLTPLWAAPVEQVLPTLESTTIEARFVIKDGATPFARLYVSFNPAWRTLDQKQVVQLQLTARGRPSQESIGAAFEFLDLGRNMIVKGFAAVTTPEMHEKWGRKDVG